MSRTVVVRGKRSLALHVENLEQRRLLSGNGAAHITIQEIPSSLASGGYEMVITGTKGNDSILISDNGTGAAGNFFVSTGSGIDYMSLHAISYVYVVTGRGTDHVTYELNGNLAPSLSEAVFAISGSKGGSGLPKVTGGGTLDFTANIVGKISESASLTVGVYSDPKSATTANVNVTGEVDGSLTIGVLPLNGISSKKAGNTTLNFNAKDTVGLTGSLQAFGVGGKNRNNLNASYFGTNDGNLSVYEVGYGKNDEVNADLEMTSVSTGTVGDGTFDAVGGTGSRLRARFTIYRGTDSTSTTGIHAEIYTMSKKSVAEQTANVTDQAAGSDTIVM
jgi:hypothetical protein